MTEIPTSPTANSIPFLREKLEQSSAKIAILSSTHKPVDTVFLMSQLEVVGYSPCALACGTVDLLENRQIKLNLDRTLEKSSKL